IGFDHVAGFLQGGLTSLNRRPDLTKTTQRVSPSLASEFVATGELLPVDVRTPNEREMKRIAGSIGIPLSRFKDRMTELPRNRPLLVHCAGGYRSSIAASLLQRDGFTKITELAGGLAAWEAAQLPLAGPASTSAPQK